jgi:hypothetical protein
VIGGSSALRSKPETATIRLMPDERNEDMLPTAGSLMSTIGSGITLSVPNRDVLDNLVAALTEARDQIPT